MVAYFAFLLLPAAHALVGRRQEPELIPRTNVPIPPDYEDYARGHPVLSVFPENGTFPGERSKDRCPGVSLPCFDPEADSPEVWMKASPYDSIGLLCAPGGQGGVGHYFYNVWKSELVSFVVPPGTPGRKDSAVIIAPGGGFQHLAWEPEGISPAQWFNSMGISAFVLKYRVPNKGPSLLDAQRALSLVRSKAREFGINASKVGFMGSSAGGFVALNLATAKERMYSRIDSVDDVDFRPDFLLTLYPSIPKFDGDHSTSLLPPTFIAFAEDDPCCAAKQTHSFVKAAKKKSPITMHSFPQGRHGWQDPEYWPTVKGLECNKWREYAVDWLKGLGVL